MAARKSFADQVAKVIAKQKKEIDEACCRVVRELMHSIIDYTPVGKEWYGNFHNTSPGTLVNNWQPAINSLSTYTQQRPGPSKTGARRRVDMTVVNGTFLKDGYVTFANSTPYANLAENIGWMPPKWSGATGPYAMVRKSIAEIKSKYA